MKIKAGRYYLLAIAVVIPYGLIFITSLLKWIFGNFLFPKPVTLLAVGPNKPSSILNNNKYITKLDSDRNVLFESCFSSYFFELIIIRKSQLAFKAVTGVKYFV